eukprot:1961639-Pyramimonas_sp.AAC.2
MENIFFSQVGDDLCWRIFAVADLEEQEATQQWALNRASVKNVDRDNFVCKLPITLPPRDALGPNELRRAEYCEEHFEDGCCYDVMQNPWSRAVRSLG